MKGIDTPDRDLKNNKKKEKVIPIRCGIGLHKWKYLGYHSGDYFKRRDSAWIIRFPIPQWEGACDVWECQLCGDQKYSNIYTKRKDPS